MKEPDLQRSKGRLVWAEGRERVPEARVNSAYARKINEASLSGRDE